MFKKLLDLQATLQADKDQLETELSSLNAIIDQPEVAPFDELSAAKRLTSAKSADHLEDTQTAEGIGKAIDKERAELAKQLAAISKQKAEARQKQAVKQAQLTAIDSELASIDWNIKTFIQQQAQSLLQAKTESYRVAAVALLNALIDIDALNAIIADMPNENPAKLVLLVKSLPKVGLENAAEVEPWQIQEHGEKIIFASDSAFPIVNSRYLAITEDIKGTLYDQ